MVAYIYILGTLGFDVMDGTCWLPVTTTTMPAAATTLSPTQRPSAMTSSPTTGRPTEQPSAPTYKPTYADCLTLQSETAQIACLKDKIEVLSERCEATEEYQSTCASVREDIRSIVGA